MKSVQLNVILASWLYMVYAWKKKSMKLFIVPRIPYNAINSPVPSNWKEQKNNDTFITY